MDRIVMAIVIISLALYTMVSDMAFDALKDDWKREKELRMSTEIQLMKEKARVEALLEATHGVNKVEVKDENN